jgi:pyruvate/2-oxoglutarate dehydrogenase complex dihydrolipoamide acyltransferase (E2) component
MGVSVAEGTVVEWHKQVGDSVQADETICEISTDKIDTEVPSPVTGRIVEILVSAEETVPVGTVLARVIPDGADMEAHPSHATGGNGATAATAAAASHSASPPAPSGASSAGTGSRSGPRYSPVVQRIAAEHGLDLETVPGTGRDGRVRKQDVLAAVAAATIRDRPAGEPPSTRAPSVPPAAGVSPQPPLHTESPYRPDPLPPAVPAEGGVPAQAEGDTSERLSRIRRTIGEHMLRSLRTAAHCTTIVEADFTRIEAPRRQLQLTYLPFLARCVIEALNEYPSLNATLEGDTLTTHRDVNLGIAVALGDEGLIVPVIHRAQELSVEGLGRRIAELGRRARARELTNDDVVGATFTITNPGAFGAIAATPIINQPQVAILDLEAVVKRPVVVTDASGQDAIAIRPMANLCMSWDHRALDGALAARFLSAVKRNVESYNAT